jgi:hypothetical protein
MPGTGPGGQLPGAGARAAARPNRPRRASKYSSAWPWKAIVAREHAMTAARASPSGEPARSSRLSAGDALLGIDLPGDGMSGSPAPASGEGR